MTTTVYCNKNCELLIDEVQELFHNVDVSRVSTLTAHKPSGGEIYVYCYGDTTTKNDWVADGYRWFSVGCDRLPRRQPVLYKRKFQTVTRSGPSSAFKRVAYSVIGPTANDYILVHYIGDETLAEDLPHGNVKKREEARPFQRTAPSVLAQRAAEAKVRSSELYWPSDCTADNISNQSYNSSKFNKHLTQLVSTSKLEAAKFHVNNN